MKTSTDRGKKVGDIMGDVMKRSQRLSLRNHEILVMPLEG